MTRAMIANIAEPTAAPKIPPRERVYQTQAIPAIAMSKKKILVIRPWVPKRPIAPTNSEAAMK